MRLILWLIRGRYITGNHVRFLSYFEIDCVCVCTIWIFRFVILSIGLLFILKFGKSTKKKNSINNNNKRYTQNVYEYEWLQFINIDTVCDVSGGMIVINSFFSYINIVLNIACIMNIYIYICSLFASANRNRV